LSTVEVFANSNADHGLVPLGAGRGYVPVLCYATATITATATTHEVFAQAAGGTALVGDVPSAGIPVRGSAKELLSVRSSSIG
jgi:hypothetical protein